MERLSLRWYDDECQMEADSAGEYVRHEDAIALLERVAGEFEGRELARAAFLLRDLASAMKGDVK